MASFLVAVIPAESRLSRFLGRARSGQLINQRPTVSPSASGTCRASQGCFGTQFHCNLVDLAASGLFSRPFIAGAIFNFGVSMTPKHSNPPYYQNRETSISVPAQFTWQVVIIGFFRLAPRLYLVPCVLCHCVGINPEYLFLIQYASPTKPLITSIPAYNPSIKPDTQTIMPGL
jgi:hypothetical protein